MPELNRSREALGARLRALRIGTGRNGKEMAAALNCQPSKVTRIELGQQTPTLKDLEAWVGVCGADNAVLEDLRQRLATIETFYREWRRQVREGMHARQRTLADEEARTRVMRVLEPVFVPGLVQTEEYARVQLLQAARDMRVPPVVDEAVAQRMERQAILYETGKRFHMVITEAALRLGLAPPDVMSSQLDRLIAVTTMRRVRLGVIPFGTTLPVAPQHGYWIHDERIVYVETVSAELAVTDPDEVGQYLREFAMLASVAYYDQAARDLITRAATLWAHPHV